MSVLESLLSQGTIERLGWMLVHFLWQATAVALLLAILLRVLHRRSANSRYIFACGALALMVVLPVMTMRFIKVPGPAAEAGPPPEVVTPATTPAPMIVEFTDELPALSSPTAETADLTVPVPWHERFAAAVEPALPYVVLGWLVGVFGLSAWHLGGWAQLHRLKGRMVREAGNALHTTLGELAIRLGVRRAVILLESALVEVPTVVGWLRPTILLPASALTGLSPDQLRAILAHELAHIRRYDYLANIVQTVVEILGFYHPAIWWISHQIRIERENCCDDLAVRVCDNSLQYARALASMEEIRHSRTELAVAASGGSLMVRIARLLGRPAVDDRRFTWLPGLITLLLVIGVVIPAAFALAHPTPDVAEPTADNAAAPTEDIRDATDPNTPPQVYIAVRLVLTEVFCDTVLDPQTAAEATELLTRLVPSDADNPSSPPTTEELQRPLADVFSKFAPAPGQSRQFIDLLASRKRYVASNLSAPQVTVLSGESLSFTLGNVASPDTSQSQDSEPPLVRCSVTATKTENQNTIRMDIDLLREYPVYRPDDPNSETAAWAINTTILVPNDQWTAIAGNMAKRTDESGRECLQLPLVLATIVPDSEARDMDTPGTVPMIPSADGTIHLPPGMGGLRPTNPAGPTQVLTKFLLFSEALPDKVVDRETRNLLAEVLTREDSQALREIIHADPQRDVTLSDVFRTWIGRNPLPPETMEILIDVLQSRGYLPGETTPEVLADLNRQGRMNLITERLRLSQADPASAPEQVKLGVFVQVTPHIPPSGDNLVRLEVAAQWKERAEPSDANEMPAIRTTEIVSTLAIPDGQCAALVAMNAGESNAGFHLLVVGPPTVIRPMTSPAPIISPPSGAVTADEPARTQVLLSFTIVDVLADRVLDPDAAVQARNLLM